MITKEIVESVKGFLKQDGIAYFKSQFIAFGGKLIHLHFTDGMAIRNHLRNTGLCTDWTCHELDVNWIRIVEKVMLEDYTEEEMNDGVIFTAK